jgi:hypothetical protein
MSVRNAVIGLAVLAVALAAGTGYWMYSRSFQPPLGDDEVLPVAEYRFSGPFTHENLTVFLIHGREAGPERDYLTLEEALAQGKVIVHETKQVQELSIENRSNEDVFIQAGDVVKGGQQDRTFPSDFIVPPQSGRLPIDSLCVEQFRWAQRGKEDVEVFAASYSNATSRVKLAAALRGHDQKQKRVWEEVASVRRNSARNVAMTGLDLDSGSSYQLLTEQREMKNATGAYIEALKSAPGGAKDVVGVVVVVNGQVSSADVFGSAKLFARLWPRLLDSAAVGAFADLEKGKKYSPTSLDKVKRFLSDAEAGSVVDETRHQQRAHVHVRQADRQMMLDTHDRGRNNVMIHRSFLAR